MEIFISVVVLAAFGYFLYTRIRASQEAKENYTPSPRTPNPRPDSDRNLD